MPQVTQAQIVRELRRLGVRAGDIVVAHSALSSFGQVAGGARRVVDALIETVGPKGTLLMPTLTLSTPYDYRKSPSAMGAVTEQFRKRPGVLRSLNPLVPAAALGPRAREFIAGHHLAECPYIGSPYDLAAKAGGWVLLLGVDQDRNTTLHCAEALAKAPYLGQEEARYLDRRGKATLYRGNLCAGPHRNFIGTDPKLRAAGIVRMGKIGRCVVRLMKGQELIDFCVSQIRKDPAFFITGNEGYYDGIMQRGRIRAARLREEAFTLIARTGSAGANLEETLWHCERAGVRGVELDRVNGRDVSELSVDELALLLRRLKERHLKVALVRSNILTDAAFEAAVRAGNALEARGVIAPLTGSLASLRSRMRIARAAKLQMLFENVGIGSAAAVEMMKSLAPAAGLAFNPANFAAAGELAFLTSFRAAKKYVRYVAIADASPLGAPCIPGNGYGEVKEIVSILRCGSFDGYFSLGAGPGTGLAFDGITDAFYSLLDNC